MAHTPPLTEVWIVLSSPKSSVVCPFSMIRLQRILQVLIGDPKLSCDLQNCTQSQRTCTLDELLRAVYTREAHLASGSPAERALVHTGLNCCHHNSPPSMRLGPQKPTTTTPLHQSHTSTSFCNLTSPPQCPSLAQTSSRRWPA